MSRGDETQLESGDPAAVRISVGMKRAVLHVLSSAAQYKTPDELAEAIAVAVVTAEDDKTRWCVVTLDPNKNLWVYGPYATAQTAGKVAAGGNCSTMAGTRAVLKPLINAPKSLAPKKKAPAKKAGASTKGKVVN